MSVVYLGLGSNLDPETNLKLGVRELASRFELRRVSSVYRNPPVGFDGDDFLNAVACAETALSPEAVGEELERIHAIAGRERRGHSFASRTLDIDLLMYDDVVSEALKLPRKDILAYSFVLGPIAEIAPDLIHPVTGRTMSAHWSEMGPDAHPLEREAVILSNDGD